MKKILLLLVVLSQIVFAQSFDFNSKGDSSANEILKNYVEKTYDIEDVDSAREKIAEIEWSGWIIKSAITEQKEVDK